MRICNMIKRGLTRVFVFHTCQNCDKKEQNLWEAVIISVPDVQLGVENAKPSYSFLVLVIINSYAYLVYKLTTSYHSLEKRIKSLGPTYNDKTCTFSSKDLNFSFKDFFEKQRLWIVLSLRQLSLKTFRITIMVNDYKTTNESR